MTCRDEVVDAFDALHRETGRRDFAPAEVLRQMRAAGSTYRDSTIRTHVTAHMVEDGSLVRIGPGRYRLSRHRHHPPDEPPPAEVAPRTRITEDEVKAAVMGHLEAAGWVVEVAWARQPGIDIEARRGADRLVLEAKGEAPPGPQQANDFVNALGEVVQRMDDPTATYGLALPDHRQYRGLVDRLPALATERLRLTVFFVRRDGASGFAVTRTGSGDPDRGPR